MLQRRKLWAAGAAALVVVAVIAILVRGDRPATREPGAAPAARDVPRDVPVRVYPDPAEEETPGVHCWEGLLELDRAGELASFRDVLARAVASGDDLLARYVQDRLAELVGGDVARAMQLLDWADAAGPRELEILLGALQATAAVQDPTVARRLLGMGEDADGGEHRRAIALTALETQHRLPAEDLGRLAAIALDGDAGDAGWAATRTVGRVMKQDFEKTGSYEPYWDQLLAIGRAATDHAVRLLALEMPAYADPILAPKYIDELADLLMNAPEREIREMAAFQLAVTEDPGRALAAYRTAFPRERDLCVRWAIFRFTVRAAGKRAIPTLEAYARTDRRFRVDLEEFRAIFATGVEDFERVWLEKAEHHPCSVEHEEHGS